MTRRQAVLTRCEVRYLFPLDSARAEQMEGPTNRFMKPGFVTGSSRLKGAVGASA